MNRYSLENFQKDFSFSTEDVSETLNAIPSQQFCKAYQATEIETKQTFKFYLITNILIFFDILSVILPPPLHS